MSFSKKNSLLCCISGCPNSLSGQVQPTVFYVVPKDPARAKKWTEIIEPRLVLGVPLLKGLTCSKHFRQHDYENNNSDSFKLKPTALPSIFEEEESFIPQKKLKLRNITTPGQSKQVPLNTAILNSPETRVFVLEASLFSNSVTSRPEPRKILPKQKCQDKKDDTVSVEAGRLKHQISLARSKKRMLSIEYNEVAEEEQKLAKKITKIDQELKGYKDKELKFSKEELVLLKKCFSPAQIRHLHGNKKAYWTEDDLAMGFNITCMTSTNFYKYLREEMQYPLPAVSNITKCTEEKGDEIAANIN